MTCFWSCHVKLWGVIGFASGDTRRRSNQKILSFHHRSLLRTKSILRFRAIPARAITRCYHLSLRTASWLRTVCVCRFPGLLAKGPRDECGTLLTLLALTEWYFSLCPTMPDTIDVIDYPEALLEIGGCHCRLWLEWTR